MRLALARLAVWATVVLGLSFVGCKEDWDSTQHPLRDEELESAFFSGDAQSSAALLKTKHEYDQVCGGNWTALGLNVPDRIGDVPFRTMATLEIHPDAVLVENGFRVPKTGNDFVTQEDFPVLIDNIRRACDAELGSGTALPAARANESSRVGG